MVTTENGNLSTKLLAKLFSLLEEKGVGTDRLHRILGSGVLADVFDSKAVLNNRSAIRNALALSSLHVSCSKPFALTVDYQSVKSSGIKYLPAEHKNMSAAYRSVQDMEVVEYLACLIGFNYPVQIYDVLAEIAKYEDLNSWRPGRFEHLVAYSQAFPKAEYPHVVVAPGPFPFDDEYLVAAYGGEKSVRGFSSFELGLGDIDTGYRYLMVKPINQE